MHYEIVKNIHVLGKTIIKPERQFSFLSYLITGKSNILIDTVPARSAEQFLQDIESIIPINKLDALILNHSEEDHSGALKILTDIHPEIPIYCTIACKNRLSKEYPELYFHTIVTGKQLKISDLVFTFFETPGLHWDDNMVTFLESRGVLFSNDLFGQYAGAEPPFDTQYSEENLICASQLYYEKVFHLAQPEEKRILLEILKLPIHLIAPGHGVILNNLKDAIIECYVEKFQIRDIKNIIE